MDISVIGSCQSRDIFNSRFIKEYKEHFTMSSYFTMTSMISIMGSTAKYNYSMLIKSGFKDCLMEHWYQELEKNALKTLESKQPDVLLMDFYADARYGVIAYGKEFIINRTNKLHNKGILDLERFGKVYDYENNTEIFVLMWKKAFDEFMGFMKEKLPNTTIIINTVKGTKMATDEEGNQYVSPTVEELDVEKINKIWSEFDEYAIEKYGLRALRYTKEYTLDANYPFSGLGYALVHFHPDYYVDCFEQLLEQTKDLSKSEKKDVSLNLITDSDYQHKLRRWSNKKGKFELVEYTDYRAIRAVDCREKLGNYRPQVWSRPVEIIGDGKTTYTISFVIKIADKSLLEEEEVIFGIRTFKYMKELKMTESIEEYPLTIKGHDIQNGEEYKYVFTFAPRGNYLKVAPFMFRYVPGVEYSKIKLERASNASE